MNPLFSDHDFTPRSVRSRFASCEPVSMTLAMGGLAAAGAGTSIVGQTQQNKAAKQVEQQKANAVDKQIAENRRRATADYIQTVQDEQLLQSQEEDALVEKKIDLGRTERTANAEALVAAGESGVAGQSLAMIQADYRFQMDQAASRLGINQQMANYQHTRNIEAAGVTYENRATSIQPYQRQPVKPVDFFGPVFAAVGQTADVAMRTGAYRELKNPFASE